MSDDNRDNKVKPRYVLSIRKKNAPGEDFDRGIWIYMGRDIKKTGEPSKVVYGNINPAFIRALYEFGGDDAETAREKTDKWLAHVEEKCFIGFKDWGTVVAAAAEEAAPF